MKPSDLMFYNVVPLTCICGAIYLMAHNVNGWGWLILIAAFTAVMPRISESKND